MPNYQNRLFLQLSDKTEEIELTKKILKSPLGLANDLIVALFENKLESKKEELDEIKGFAAGVSRAEKLGETYSLARYYPYMFAFQQFFSGKTRKSIGRNDEKYFNPLYTLRRST